MKFLVDPERRTGQARCRLALSESSLNAGFLDVLAESNWIVSYCFYRLQLHMACTRRP